MNRERDGVVGYLFPLRDHSLTEFRINKNERPFSYILVSGSSTQIRYIFVRLFSGLVLNVEKD